MRSIWKEVPRALTLLAHAAREHGRRDLEDLVAWHYGDLRAVRGSPKRFGWVGRAPRAGGPPDDAPGPAHDARADALRRALPTNMVKVLARAFERAPRQGLADGAYARWTKKVRFEALGCHPRRPGSATTSSRRLRGATRRARHAQNGARSSRRLALEDGAPSTFATARALLGTGVGRLYVWGSASSRTDVLALDSTVG